MELPIVGVDTGGTFTDFIVFDAGGLRSFKTLSTPQAPEQAILSGLKALGLEQAVMLLRHGSTVATNAVLEGKGVKTAYVSNRGFADVLTIGRQSREELYALSVPAKTPPVVSELCFETGGRVTADGSMLESLSAGDISQLRQQLIDADVKAVAVNLLFSYLDDSSEQAIAQALPDEMFVCLSSEVLAEIGEYERGIACWLNAYVGPKMASYLSRLSQGASHARISVMQSDGLTISADQAASRAVNLLLSGPAGGLVGAREVAAASGFRKVMTLDVGGTSSDVALIDGDLRITRQGRIGNYPVAVPMVDMHTVGAGGGSIASLDDAGMLRVGPESAGASPGPACYGQGGEVPTLTDANLILGRLPTGLSLGSNVSLNRELAVKAVQPLATAMGCSLEQAAQGIVSIANETMARALRLISVERGYDPKEFVLCGFGGAGGLHVCELAMLLGMQNILIPAHAGVLSALGMAMSAPGRERTHTRLAVVDDLGEEQIQAELTQLSEQLEQELREECGDETRVTVKHSLDLRYAGQSFTLTVPWSNLHQVAEEFHHKHRQRYGHSFDFPIELVNLRVRMKAAAPTIDWRSGNKRDLPQLNDGVIWRDQLEQGVSYPGPLIIVDTVGSTWVHPEWQASIDDHGNLLATACSQLN